MSEEKEINRKGIKNFPRNEKELKKALEDHLKDIEQKIIEVKNSKEIPEEFKQWLINHYENGKKAWGKFLQKEPKK